VKTIKELGTWLLILVGIAGVITFVVFDIWSVPDDEKVALSLEPNVHSGDTLLVLRAGTGAAGHLVRCADPGGRGFVVARLVASNGERVAFGRENVSVDGRSTTSRVCDGAPFVFLKHPATGREAKMHCSIEEMNHGTAVLTAADFPDPDRSYVSEPGRGFLVSDNRHFHHDSRDFGQVDLATCRVVAARVGTGNASRFTVLW
jgi:signal peptidase I